MLSNKGLETYCQKALSAGTTQVTVIEGKQIITSPWVRWKCQFGCQNYDKYYCCPPRTPTPEQTRQMLDSYNRAILFHLQWTHSQQSGRVIKAHLEITVSLERDLFLDGYYRAFSLLAGPCMLCKECALVQNSSCSFPEKARPSLEACGIDVYQTVQRLGMPLYPLRDTEETRNIYTLLLVD